MIMIPAVNGFEDMTGLEGPKDKSRVYKVVLTGEIGIILHPYLPIVATSLQETMAIYLCPQGGHCRESSSVCQIEYETKKSQLNITWSDGEEKGPCAGKTTVQAMMSTFFENLGWKVYRVPEAATVLLGGGVKFPDLDEEEVYRFQENLMKTLLQLEQTFFDLAVTCQRNTLVISDRGAMDPSSYMNSEQWQRLLSNNSWNNVTLRDARYDQVIHLVSAAQGAEEFYITSNNHTRMEPVEQARKLDRITQQAWVGHPYVDVIDNSTDFNNKVRRAIEAVCTKLRLNTGDRLSPESVKRKFLVSSLPDKKAFPVFQDFDVIHDYLSSSDPKSQARLRKRGQNGHYTYMHTLRKETKINEQVVEVRTNLSSKDYERLYAQLDHSRQSVYKTRRCFLWNNQYFQLDIYNEPCHARCKGLLILETYTTERGDALKRPDFLDIVKEVTGDPKYSMFHLALKN